MNPKKILPLLVIGAVIAVVALVVVILTRPDTTDEAVSANNAANSAVSSTQSERDGQDGQDGEDGGADGQDGEGAVDVDPACQEVTAQSAIAQAFEYGPIDTGVPFDWDLDAAYERGIDACADLSLVVIGIEGGSSGSATAALFFHKGGYLGELSGSRDGGIAYWQRGRDSVESKFTDPGGDHRDESQLSNTVTYRWDGEKVVVEGKTPGEMHGSQIEVPTPPAEPLPPAVPERTSVQPAEAPAGDPWSTRPDVAVLEASAIELPLIPNSYSTEQGVQVEGIGSCYFSSTSGTACIPPVNLAPDGYYAYEFPSAAQSKRNGTIISDPTKATVGVIGSTYSMQTAYIEVFAEGLRISAKDGSTSAWLGANSMTII